MPAELSEDEIGEKRSLLVQCALNILEQEGGEALTLRRLATTASVSRSTPYLYFKDKAALLEAVRVKSFALLADACEQAIENQDGSIKKMRLIGETYVAFAINRPTLYKLLFAASAEGEMSPELQAAADRYDKISSAPMHEAYKDGSLAMPPERLVPVLWASIHGLLELRNAGLLGGQEAFERVQEDLNLVLA